MVIVIINILYVVDAKNRYNQAAASGGGGMKRISKFLEFRILTFIFSLFYQNPVIPSSSVITPLSARITPATA